MLPVFLVAGEAVWREATGKGFALDIRQDAGALLGRRLHAVGSGTFSTVMLSVIEASQQVVGPRSLLVNDFGVQWAASLTRGWPVAGGLYERGDQPMIRQVDHRGFRHDVGRRRASHALSSLISVNLDRATPGGVQA